MADRTLLETRFDDLKGRITEAWGAITDDDLKRLQGRWDQVVALIRRKTGEGLVTVESKLDTLIDALELRTDDTEHAKEQAKETVSG